LHTHTQDNPGALFKYDARFLATQAQLHTTLTCWDGVLTLEQQLVHVAISVWLGHLETLLHIYSFILWNYYKFMSKPGPAPYSIHIL